MARGVRSARTRHKHHALNNPAVNDGPHRTITLHLHRVAEGAQPGEPLFVDINDLLHTLADRDLVGPGIGPWCHTELLGVLASWADDRDESLRESAEKVATVSLPESREGWRFHSVLGFNKD
jgi:CRISPR-associated endonuclease/helicase Cas3